MLYSVVSDLVILRTSDIFRVYPYQRIYSFFTPQKAGVQEKETLWKLKRRNWTKKPWYRRFRKSWLKSIHVPIQTNLNH